MASGMLFAFVIGTAYLWVGSIFECYFSITFVFFNVESFMYAMLEFFLVLDLINEHYPISLYSFLLKYFFQELHSKSYRRYTTLYSRRIFSNVSFSLFKQHHFSPYFNLIKLAHKVCF